MFLLRIKLLLILLLFVGCTTKVLNAPELPEDEWVHKQNRNIETFKKYYFTPEAFKAIENIYVYRGFTGQLAQSWGINTWTDILSVFTGIGPGRKVTIRENGFKERGMGVLIHEYIHHLDDIDRDGDGEFIDHEEWEKAYIRLSKDPKWRGIVIYTEKASDNLITDIFGVGEYSEHIAYSGHVAFWYGGPDYFLNVYRKMFRLDRKQRYKELEE